MKRKDFHSNERFSAFSILLTSLIHLPILYLVISVAPPQQDETFNTI